MSMADELRKLAELRDAGVLNSFEFEQAKARVLNGEPALTVAQLTQRLRRSRTDRWIGGVCGGLGASTGVESWVWRLLFVFTFLFAGIGIIPYILLWIFVPEDELA